MWALSAVFAGAALRLHRPGMAGSASASAGMGLSHASASAGMGLSHDDVSKVTLRCVGEQPATPPAGSEHRSERAMLRKLWIMQQLELHVTLQSGKTCIEQLGYINRGAGRGVFGNGTIAAKLQQWNYHEGSNAKEAAEILKVTKEWWNKWPDRVCRVLWCGRAELVAKWLKPPTELSCLLVEQQGEDLLCRVRRVANDAHQPVPQRMQRLYKIFRAFLEFFLEAWAAGIFIGDYGLRQICVRQGHPESGDSSLTAKNLVLVDVEGLTPRPSSGYAKLLTKMWKSVATELKAVLVQAHIDMLLATSRVF